MSPYPHPTLSLSLSVSFSFSLSLSFSLETLSAPWVNRWCSFGNWNVPRREMSFLSGKIWIHKMLPRSLLLMDCSLRNKITYTHSLPVVCPSAHHKRFKKNIGTVSFESIPSATKYRSFKAALALHYKRQGPCPDPDCALLRYRSPGIDLLVSFTGWWIDYQGGVSYNNNPFSCALKVSLQKLRRRWGWRRLWEKLF